VDDLLKRPGKRIREIRIQRGFASQEAFADYCKMHRTYVGILEAGRRDLHLKTIVRIADALGVTLSELFAGVDRGESFEADLAPVGSADLQRVRQELEAMEQSLRHIKELALVKDRSASGGAQNNAAAKRRAPRRS